MTESLQNSAVTGDRPRLLLVSPLPPPAGGIASWTVRLLKSRLHERYEIRVLNTNTGQVDNHVGGLTGRKAALAVRFLTKFTMILLSWRPDVVHINTSGFLPLFALDGIHAALGRVAGAVTVLHVRGSAEDMWERTQPRLRGLQGRMFRRANRVLVLHQTGLEVLNRHGIEAHVMSNFVMSRPEVHRGDRSGPVRILFVGWLKPYKGVLELIEATGRLEGVELVLLGRFVDGAENEIRAAMSAAGLDGRVQLPGEVPLEEVWKHYEAADIFCLPSWTEGFPNTLVEAMMSGLPVVATPVGAIPEVLVDGETGTLTPVRDAAALETALRVLVADSALRHRMGDAGRARALSRYEMNSVLNQLADHYDELLQR